MNRTKQAAREEARLNSEIANRARTMADKAGFDYPLLDANMDISAAHETHPLRLSDLLAADDSNFCHDVFGIFRHLNRETHKLENCFSPRFSA
jgi:hypothetical protein